MSRQGDVLRGWLGLLDAVEATKKTLDTRLRDQFGVSLSGFDVLAALESADPDGLRAGALTRRLRVSDGATSQVAATLEKLGLIVRERAPSDRRAVVIRLTREGRSRFRAMARAHHRWLQDAFRALDSDSLADLSKLVGAIDPASLAQPRSRERI